MEGLLAGIQWKENRGGRKYRDTPWQGHYTQSKAQKAKPEAQGLTLTCLLSSVFPVKLSCRVLIDSRGCVAEVGWT